MEAGARLVVGYNIRQVHVGVARQEEAGQRATLAKLGRMRNHRRPSGLIAPWPRIEGAREKRGGRRRRGAPQREPLLTWLGEIGKRPERQH